jgi:hypothetical protein
MIEDKDIVITSRENFERTVELNLILLEAIDWIEEEVRKNGIVEIRRMERMVDTDGSRVLRFCPDGHFKGFSISSQHTDGNDWNLLQLVATMKRLSERKDKK